MGEAPLQMGLLADAPTPPRAVCENAVIGEAERVRPFAAPAYEHIEGAVCASCRPTAA
jgi:hypothetical protein